MRYDALVLVCFIALCIEHIELISVTVNVTF